MDIVHDILSEVLGYDKTRFVDQAKVYYMILCSGGLFFYLFFASCSFFYSFVLKRDTYFPPTIKKKDLARQVAHEIWIAVASIPFMAVAMLPCPLFLYRGYGKMYKNVDDYGWSYFFLSIPCFLLFTDCLVYWSHRGLHHPVIYKHLHKIHHTYKFTTPFSSHAFHPLDGFMQGVPYYIFCYLFPMHNVLFIFMFVCINMWTISIHDQIDFGGHFINTTGHHTIHHEIFNYNYGQYTTTWDRIGGTYKPAKQTHKLF